jgi:hypothetical protein
MVEFYPLWQSNAGLDLPFLHEWSERYMRVLSSTGKNPRVGSLLDQHMAEAGFQNIHTSVEQLPVGPWNTRKS